MSGSLSPSFEAALLSRIEDAGLNASVPSQQRWVDGWLVRFSPGKAKRARCINAIAPGRMPLAERLEACAQVFSDANLPLIVRITPFTIPADLDLLLEQQGLRRFDDTRVMVSPELVENAVPLGIGITIQAMGLEAFAQRVGCLRGSALAQRQAHAQRLMNSPVPFTAYELRANGEPVACGQYAIEGNLVGLYDVFTAEAERGRGFAAALCRHMLEHARLRGARRAYLQVEGDNHCALSVYRRLGFADGYTYHYRTADPSAA